MLSYKNKCLSDQLSGLEHACKWLMIVMSADLIVLGTYIRIYPCSHISIYTNIIRKKDLNFCIILFLDVCNE